MASVAIDSRIVSVPGAGIEPAASTFRAWRHYQQQLPRSRRFGKEDSNLHRLIQSQGACRLADSRERPAGVEPACRTWEARAWPLGPGRYARSRIPDARFQIPESVRDRGFEPRSPGWKPGVVPLDQSRAASCNQKRKERESNPQGSSLARVRVGCRRQSACPSVIANGDRRCHRM